MIKKVLKSLKALAILARKPYLLNLVLDENDQWRNRFTSRYPDKEKLRMISLADLLGTIHETVSPFLFLDGGSLPTDLLLLKGLARKFENCSYFEIGTWRGESVANVASVAEDCYTMDLPDEEKRALGMSEAYIKDHAVLSRHLSNVNHLKENSFTYDFSSLNKKFDLVFIDGDHHYESVKRDTQKVFSHLVHPNSIVVWHDYAYNPEKVRYEVLNAILDGVAPEFQGNIYAVSNTMCAVYFPGNIQADLQSGIHFELGIKGTRVI
jgi:predicted O-methyltransferase YrrM